MHLHYNPSRKLTTYLVSSSRSEDWVASIKQTLIQPRMTSIEHASILREVTESPFALHAIISGLAFSQSQEFVRSVREKLMLQIRKVNDYSELTKDVMDTTPLENTMRNRAMLENITKELHLVSQTADTGIANADMSLKLCQKMLNAYMRLSDIQGKASKTHAFRSTEDALRYTLESMKCQKDWLISYKARKDTAMNFVSLLVLPGSMVLVLM